MQPAWRPIIRGRNMPLLRSLAAFDAVVAINMALLTELSSPSWKFEVSLAILGFHVSLLFRSWQQHDSVVAFPYVSDTVREGSGAARGCDIGGESSPVGGGE